MKCHECRSEMSLVYNMDHYHCAGCNVYEFPSFDGSASDTIQPLGNTTDFFCPCCPEINLEVGQILGAQVCFCPNCRGYVIDTGTLGSLISSLRASYTGPDDQPAMMNQEELNVTTSCPACLEPMQTHPYHGPGTVILDSCMNCKLSWLGHGELNKIVKAPGVRKMQSY